MYFPLSQISTNLYTSSGEFQYPASSGKVNLGYTGYYFKTSDGRYFTGKTPQDVPNDEIVPTRQDILATSNPSGASTSNYITVPRVYSNSNPRLPVGNYPPKISIPFPTQDDYNTGEFQRYFSKQINDTKFTEINKSDFNALVSKDSSYLWELFITISIPWDITGNKDQAEQTNKNITLLTESKNKIFGFSKFIELTGGYLKFYK